MKTSRTENGGRRVWAPAKINLFFEILFKRNDGYHEIETLAVPVAIFDEIEIDILENNQKTTLACFDEYGAEIPDVPTDARNLVWQAADAFFDEIGEKSPLSIKILKKIPSKAGLGGGSSDAAATLLVLNELYGVPLTSERLREIGGGLGSDVPLFFEDGASIGRGRGEKVEPFDLPEFWLVVLKPNEGLSTPAVFQRFATLPPQKKHLLNDFCREITCADRSSVVRTIAAGLRNRLEESASALWSGVERYKSLLLASPNVLGAQMSGSGTAFFAIYPSENAAREATAWLERKSVGEKIFIAKSVGSQDGAPQKNSMRNGDKTRDD